MAEVGMSLISILLLCISRTAGCLPVCRNKMLPKMLSAMMWMSDCFLRLEGRNEDTLCEAP